MMFVMNVLEGCVCSSVVISLERRFDVSLTSC